MLNENRKIIKNFVYENNEKLKLFIKIKQNVSESDIGKNKKELNESYNKCIESNLNKFGEIKCYDDDFISEKCINEEIINRLLDNDQEYNNVGCVVSFNRYENLSTCKNNPEYEEKNDSINDIYLHNLIEYFFVKISKLSIKENEKKEYSLRYGAFNVSNMYDLLEEYEKNIEHYKKKERYTLKKEKKQESLNANMNKQPNNVLKNFNKNIKAVKFSDLEKLKDILNFATNKKILLEKNFKMNDPFYYTLITIEIIRQDILIRKNNRVLKSNSNSNDNKSILNKFYFLNIIYFNSNNDKENINKEEVKKPFYEIKNLINHYINGDLKINISNFNQISKIFYEICCDLVKIHLKVVLYTLDDCDHNDNENVLNFLYSIDFKLKEYLSFLGREVNTLEEVSHGSKDDDKDLVILKNEKYQKLDRLLFENIDLDENMKNKVIKEAMNLPEESYDCLELLNKTFQHNYTCYKEKEKEFHKSILNLVEKQNEIIKSYEEEEKKKKNEINNILKEIHYISEKNIEIKNEIQKHQHLTLKYLQKEENNELHNFKRFNTIDNSLKKEYEHFLKFRNESANEDEIIKKKEKEFYSFEKNVSSEDKILDIYEKHEEEYLKNLNEAEKYAEQIFHQSHNLKKKYDDVINKKIELFKILKDTALKLNEKTNALKNNYKNTKGLKFIYSIDDNYVNFKEKYKDNLPKNNLKECNELLEELRQSDFNEKQLLWIHKMNSLSKEF